MESYSSEREIRNRIKTNDLEIQDESEIDEKIQERSMCQRHGVNITDEFPVMKTLKAWRPYKFSNESFKYWTLNNFMGFINKYIETIQSEQVYIANIVESIKIKFQDERIKIDCSKKLFEELKTQFEKETIQTILVPIQIDIDSDSLNNNSDDSKLYEPRSQGYVIIYKTFKIKEFVHPQFEDFFETLFGKEVLDIFSTFPLSQFQDISEYSTIGLSSRLSSKEIPDEFLTIFPIMKEEGYLRKSYHSFEYLWNIFMMLITRIEIGYDSEQMLEIVNQFEQFSVRFRTRLYKNFYVFLQCFSSYLWEILSEKQRTNIQANS